MGGDVGRNCRSRVRRNYNQYIIWEKSIFNLKAGDGGAGSTYLLTFNPSTWEGERQMDSVGSGPA